MNKLKLLFNRIVTADKVEVTHEDETYIAEVSFQNRTTDDNFRIDFKDEDDLFAPVNLSKKQLQDAIIEGNKINIDGILVELYKFTEYNI